MRAIIKTSPRLLPIAQSLARSVESAMEIGAPLCQSPATLQLRSPPLRSFLAPRRSATPQDYATKDAKTDEAKKVAEEMFLAKVKDKGIKLCWQVLFNGSSDPERLFYTNLWTKFSDMFPNIAARMAQDRRTRHRRLGDELRRREAEMMAEITSTMENPCITIYDSFICAKDAVDELMEVCREVTLKHLGFVHLPR